MRTEPASAPRQGLRRRARTLSTLALALALGFVPQGHVRAGGSSAKALLAQREGKALSHLMALRSKLGLDGRAGFRPVHSFTTGKGKTVVRLDHTVDGYRVMGSQAIVHVDADGGLTALPRFLEAGASPAGEPALGPEQAVAIALSALGATAPLPDAPKVERIVFPARHAGGLAVHVDPATGEQVLDRTRSVFARPSAPTVWAWQVRTREANGPNGPRELAYVIDGNTGDLLRIDDLLARQAATVEPAMGAGKGLYRGEVGVPASKMLDGRFALYDTTRGHLPNPYLSTFTPDGSGWSPTGLQVFWSEHDLLGKQTGNIFLFSENPANAWGDGKPFSSWGHENEANGQTAGVDAMSAMATTWDFYGKVLGWDGLDGRGTTTYATVLSTDKYYVDNAYWSTYSQSLTLGAGSSSLPPTHASYDPNGWRSMADFDVVAHEMTHGVTASTVKFLNVADYDEAGMSEGTSDFFAQMARLWAARPAGAPDNTIPDVGGQWQIGKNVTHDGTPIRWLDKPDRDHRSPNGWYDGAHFLDGHFSAGILNRVLYLLARGASPDPKSDSYSPYLPGGMGGIGNDATARIWFNTITERLYSGGTGKLTWADCREEAIAAAKELYCGGAADCVQSIAVENAFAAVNVGQAHGQGLRTQVLFADWRNGDWIDLYHSGKSTAEPGSFYNNRQYLPIGETVRPRITVLNNANTAVQWSIGGPSMFNGAVYYVEKGGVINADGSWTTPYNVGWKSITATSVVDPTQFAEGRPFLINMDGDQDLETDAIDMGYFAFSWYLTRALNPSHSIYNAPWTDDADVAGFVDGLAATWPVK